MIQLPARIDDTREDSWTWDFKGNSEYVVAQMRANIDKKILPSKREPSMEWIKLVPKKINVFVWRLMKDAIPTYMNMFTRGIDVPTFRCLQCDEGIETLRHTFKNCAMAVETRKLISNWVEMDIPSMEPKQIIDWVNKKKLTKSSNRILKAILYNWWWHLWKSRNIVTHDFRKEEAKDVFMSIVATSFTWASSREKKLQLAWLEWLCNPVRSIVN